MTTELISNIATARQLRDVLNSIPEHLLHLPVTAFHNSTNVAFDIHLVEVLDIIEDGTRTQLIRLTGDGEVL